MLVLLGKRILVDLPISSGECWPDCPGGVVCLITHLSLVEDMKFETRTKFIAFVE